MKQKNKKIFSTIIILTTFICFLFTVGCSSEKPIASDKGSEKNTNIAPLEVVWTSGPASGMTFPTGAAICEMIEENIPGSRTTVVEGASVTNIEQVNSGEAQMGHTMGDLVFAAECGLDPFEGGRPHVKTIANVMDFEFQFVVDKKTGITSFKELKEKKYPLRLIPGVKGYSGELATQRVLEAYGITYQDIESWGGEVLFVAWSDGVALLQDGHADAFTALSSTPTPNVTEITLTKDVTILPVEEEILQKLYEEYGYGYGEIVAGTYKGLDKTIPAVVSPMVLIARDDIPDETIEFILELIMSEEGIQHLSSVHQKFSLLTPERAIKFLFQIHPGAERFYKMKGVLD